MINIRLALSVIVYSLANITRAAVPIEEATTFSSYGVDRSGYTFWYAGACGERIGAIINYVGRERTTKSLPGILQHARDSAQYLVLRCPAVQIIELRAQLANDPALYRFVMTKATAWEPTEVVRINELQSALESAGFQTIVGPLPIYSKAFMRYQNDRLDIIYGDNLDARMVATHIERKQFSGSESQRPAEYLVRGQWYELGTDSEDGSCEQTREGYPLWGSFTMTVSSNNASLPLTRARCSEQHELSTTETTQFSDLPTYPPAVKPPSTALKLSAVLADSKNLVMTNLSGDFSTTRQPLSDTKNYRVYARRPDLCSHLEFDVIYTVNSESRDSVFGGSYDQAIRNLIPQIASRRCGNPAGISVDAYSFGDDERWDQMNFRLRPPGGEGSNKNYIKLSSHTKSQRAKVHDQWLDANLLGPSCGGPFCDLPGGRYLNAIYRGNLNGVRQIDHLYKQAVGEYINRQTRGLRDELLEPLFGAAFKLDDVQLLRSVTNKYMHAYAVWGEACLDAGAEAKTFEYTTPVIIETDEYGITTRLGGDTFDATYTLNPEFFKLRDQLGSYKGARRSDHPDNLAIKAAVFSGIVELVRTADCRSAEVKQFERELRALTERVLTEPGTIAPTTGNRVPAAAKIVTRPFPPAASAGAPAMHRIAWNAPAPLPAVALATARSIPTTRPSRLVAPSPVPQVRASSNGSTATIDTSAMSARQRQEKMAIELQAANERGLKEMTALSEPLLQGKRDGVSAATRQQLVEEYQRKATALQQRLQAELVEIRRKYQ